MEKLELKHIQYYDLSILKFVVPALNNKTITASVVNIDLGYIECCEYGVRESYSIKFLKPILRPLSDLYKEIDGKVGIVELAKIRYSFLDWKLEKLGFSSAKDRYGNYHTFEFDKGYYIFLKDSSADCVSQLECFEYLFSNRYDIYGLIDKGLAIDLNSISHE